MRWRAKADASRSRARRSTERYDLVVVGGGHQRACRRPGSTAARSPHARILDPRQPRRLRRPRQAQRVHARWPPHHRLRRQPVACSRPTRSMGQVAKGLLRDLGVDIARFETAFERKLYPSLGLSRGVFFPREAFGRDALVTGRCCAGELPTMTSAPAAATPGRLPQFVADFPISEASKAQLLALYRRTRDPLAGRARRGEARAAQAHQLPRLSDQGLRLQRGGRQLLPGPHARLLWARLRRGAGGRRARYRLSGLRRPQAAGRRQSPHGASPTSIISRTATRRWRACWCARSFPASRRATPWTTSCRRRSTTPARPAASTRSASGSIRPASTCATPATGCTSATSATARCIGSRRGMPCSPAST